LKAMRCWSPPIQKVGWLVSPDNTSLIPQVTWCCQVMFLLVASYLPLLLSANCLKSPSPSQLSLPSHEQIQHYYEIGKAECLDSIKNSHVQLMKRPIQPHYLVDWTLSSPRPACRGTPMLYQLTQQFPWAFGPKNCSTHHHCWIGVLTCSLTEDTNPLLKFSNQSLNEALTFARKIAGPSQLTAERWKRLSYQGFSIKSLRIQMRLVGYETLAAEQHLVTLTDKQTNKKAEVILGVYFLTLPGSYKFDLRLLDINPMKLYDWSPEEKRRGYEMLFSVYLGGTEARCKPYQGCSLDRSCCGCWDVALIPGIRENLIVADGLGSCFSHFSSTFKTSLREASLPLCSRGNHSGRWLQVPSFVQTHCLRSPSSPPSSPALLWGQITQLLQDAQASLTVRRDGGLLSHDLIHLLELSRYSRLSPLPAHVTLF
jgi:hypothetical protein